MEQIVVGLNERSYPIRIGAGVFGDIPHYLEKCGFPKKLIVLSNTRVAPLYCQQLSQPLINAGYQVSTVIVEDGEAYKSLQTMELIFEKMIKAGVDRSCGLIALGGGVIGDIGGFVAATYMRGIPFVQVPTTLLAQVDSSVGGKTAVNHPLGKNMIGAFYQPKAVLIDTDTLSTLEPRDLAAGMAEVIKYGVISDRPFFDFLKNNVSNVFDLKSSVLTEIIKKSCQIKANIVENDETEQGQRALLNYGHTYGHVVETLAGYGEYRHGEAVAIGMKVAAEISRACGVCTDMDVDEIVTLLQAYRLPVQSPVFALDDVIETVMRDKKVQQGSLKMVLNHGIGHAQIHAIDAPDVILAPHIH